MIKTLVFIEFKTFYLKMRATVERIDKLLSFISVLNTINTIFSILLNIYSSLSMKDNPKMSKMTQIIIYGTVSAVIEMFISCFICGSLHEKSKNVFKVLDEFNANELSENEYKEWLMFRTIASKGGFGFTIGGFASLKKTTIISVN